jgi:hypothetical protein
MTMPAQRVARPKEIKIYLYVATLATFAIGYADLIRGGISVSALLLAIGYCVLIPLDIWVDGAPASSGTDQPPYGAAAVAAAAVLVLYLLTMAPSTAMWDTSEYITAAYTFGLPHPPGNPFFVIIGRVFSLLPIAGSVAARINVLAAVCSAIAAGAWFLVAEQVLQAWIAARWLRIVGGALATVIGATAFTVWNQSVVNEKVYTVSLAGIALLSWLAVRWSVHPSGTGADRMLVLIAYLCGLGYANHMAGMLPAPAVAVMVLVRRPSTILRWKLLTVCLVAVCVGLTPFATQPIRAAHFPALNEGEPTACRTRLELSCTLSSGTLDAFEYNFNRTQYGKPDLSDRQASIGEQVGMWWMYFEWQWVRDPDGRAPLLQALCAATFLVLGLLGGWTHYSRDRRTFWYFGSLMFTMTLLLIYYLNFKLGASQDPLSPAPHEVRDRDYFFLWSFSAWGVWAAVGLFEVWQTIASLIATERRRIGADALLIPTPRAWLASSPLLFLALIPSLANASSASRARHRTTRNIAADLLNSVEPYGVLVTVGDNDTFPLWYAQEVEGIRRDVVVANTSLLNTDWYVRQIIRRPIYDYDATRGPAIYRATPWKKPSGPPLHMTFADADAVPAYYPLNGPVAFNSGPFHAIIDPQKLEHGVLERADALVLRMIQDAWPDRPIYFARSAGPYPRALGLGNYVLTQGLASKLFVPPPTGTRDTLQVNGDGWLDVRRTLTLWNDVFSGHKSTVAEGQWIDRPSASMPLLYVFTGAELTEALRTEGRTSDARAVASLSAAVAKTAGFGDLENALEQQVAQSSAGDSNGVQLRLKSREQPKTQATDPVNRRK